MNLECREETAECCTERIENIRKTILSHYCTVGITSVLRCWNKIKVIKRSALLMKQGAIVKTATWPNSLFYAWLPAYEALKLIRHWSSLRCFSLLFFYFSSAPFKRRTSIRSFLVRNYRWQEINTSNGMKSHRRSFDWDITSCCFEVHKWHLLYRALQPSSRGRRCFSVSCVSESICLWFSI